MTTYTSTNHAANGITAHPVRNGQANGGTPPPPAHNGYAHGATAPTPAAPVHNGHLNGGATPPPRRPADLDNGGPKLPEDVNPILMDVLVGVILIALYLFCMQDHVAAAPASVALLAVVLWRLSSKGRRIAGPVLTIATVMLFAGIAQYHLAAPKANGVFTVTPGDLCIPIVVTGILYYTRLRCATANIMMFLAVALLSSGLLPGEGWLVMFLAARYLFFFLVVTGLLIDFITLLQRGDAPMEAAHA